MLGDETSAAILRQLTEDEVHDVSREISMLRNVGEQDRTATLEDFLNLAEGPGAYGSGMEYAKSVLVAAFGQEAAKRMAERLMKSDAAKSTELNSLRRADPQHIAKIIHREHPQTIALVLCHLGGAQAAKLLNALPSEVRPQVLKRMAALDQISPETVKQIAGLISAKLQVFGKVTLEEYGGVRAVAELLGHVSAETTEAVLQEIENDDPGIAQTIRQMMFVFEDFLAVKPDAMRTVIGKVDRKILTLALKGCSIRIKEHFTSLMSSRAAEMLAEDMQALGPVRIRDVEESQQKIIAVAKQLQADGSISLQASDDEFVE